MENNELLHAGTKGMKWGQRLYQYKDGSLTPLGKARYGTKKNYAAAKRKATIAAKKKAQAKEEAKSKKNQGETETVEQKKDRILKSRSAKDLYENAHLFSHQELQTAYNRLQLEQNIKNMAPKEVDKGEQFAKNFKKNADNVSDVLESGSRLYNNIAKITNAFGGTDLPIIGGNKKGNSKKKSNDDDDDNETKTSRKEKKAEKKAAKEAKKAAKEEAKEAKKAAKEKREENSDGDVFGEGTSKGSSKQKKEGPIFDAEFTETSSSGQDYASGLLSSGRGSSSNLPALTVNSGKSYLDRWLDD